MDSVVGIDEAGRGPVLGPMVVATVNWSPDLSESIKKEGLKLEDSKNMTKSAREETANFLRTHADYRICSIPAWVISRTNVSIPQIEARSIVRLLKTLKTKTVYSDALGSGTKAHQWIRNAWPDRQFTFESGADDRYESVSAASVLAKVARDRAIHHLKDNFGQVGSGYPSDPTTQEWLENWSKNGTEWPNFVRTSWSTVRKL